VNGQHFTASGGLSVVTTNALYVKGDYNTVNWAGHAGGGRGHFVIDRF
jgi:hypothetical protein